MARGNPQPKLNTNTLGVTWTNCVSIAASMAFWYQRQKWRNRRNRNRYQLSPPARRREEQLPTTRHFHRQSAGGWGGNSVRAFLTRALNQPMGSKDHSREFLELGQIISCRNLQSLEEIKGLPICEHTSTPLPASTQWTRPETNHVPPPWSTC